MNKIITFLIRYLSPSFNKKRLSSLNEMITKASLFGLPQKDIDVAKEYIEYNEAGLALEHIAEQLFEFDVKIDEPFYQSILSVAEEMKMDRSRFDFLKKLVAR